MGSDILIDRQITAATSHLAISGEKKAVAGPPPTIF